LITQGRLHLPLTAHQLTRPWRQTALGSTLPRPPPCREPRMTSPQRLSKRLIQLIGCSRSEAERYIEGGYVRVDGEVIDRPQFMVDEQAVSLDPNADLATTGPGSFVMHLAADLGKTATLAFLVTEQRWPQDTSPQGLLPRHLQHIRPCLPLQPGVSGLQLLSQDKRLQERLAEKAADFEQEFVVDVQGTLSAEQLASLQGPQLYEGAKIRHCKVSWLSPQRLRFALKNPQPGHILSRCQALGLEVQAIKRLRIGALGLAKMPQEHWRHLLPNTPI
jgi:23S rRNA pseudouridine2604 synthase